MARSRYVDLRRMTVLSTVDHMGRAELDHILCSESLVKTPSYHGAVTYHRYAEQDSPPSYGQKSFVHAQRSHSLTPSQLKATT